MPELLELNEQVQRGRDPLQLAVLGRHGVNHAPTFPYPYERVLPLGGVQPIVERVVQPPFRPGALQAAFIELASTAVASVAFVAPGADAAPFYEQRAA
ncbi:MAG TPA: hypothetical protein VGS28_00380 [Candidatus Saccharimonadales bacterium]|nr:hypothetical protein [Candidatus Saccharimonadales bacterium]